MVAVGLLVSLAPCAGILPVTAVALGKAAKLAEVPNDDSVDEVVVGVGVVRPTVALDIVSVS